MYLATILFSLFCVSLISSVSGDPNDAATNLQTNLLTENPNIVDNEDGFDDNIEDEMIYVPRSNSFLRFGRAAQPLGSASFLRFGHSAHPAFLRFGRGDTNAGTFLRFGRQTYPTGPSNFLRFGRKGEFLRFG